MFWKLKKVKLRHYDDYQTRVYSRPWVSRVDIATGEIIHTFSSGDQAGRFEVSGYGVGTMSGELVVYNPKDMHIYAYGQERFEDEKKNSMSCLDTCFYVMYVDGEFLPCDKYGIHLDVWDLPKRWEEEYKHLMG